jgi:hypothetical protein
VHCGAFAEGGGQEMCTTFYERIPDAYCMNIQQGPDITRYPQWCYVDAECMPANSNSTSDGFINDRVSWKFCTPEKDVMTREKTVEENLRWAERNDIMPALFMKMAYPVYPGWTWEQVKPYVDEAGDTVDVSDFPESLQSGLRELVESESPVVFDSRDHHPPHGIIEGQRVFASEMNWTSFRKGSDPWAHPYQMNTVTLIKAPVTTTNPMRHWIQKLITAEASPLR